MNIRTILVLGSVLAAALLASPAHAQISRVGETFPVYNAAARGSAIAYDSVNNVYFVVSAHGTLYGRFVSPDGAPLGDVIPLQGAAGFAQFPHVAYSPDAKAFLVTYYSGQARARMISYTAGFLSEDIAISPGAIVYEIMGAPLAYSTVSKEFFVVWRNYLTFDIQGVRIGNSGAPLGGVVTLNDGALQLRNNPAIAYNPQRDEYLVAYAAGLNNARNITVQRVKAGTGQVLTGPVVLGESVSIYTTAASYNPITGQYLVAWHQAPPNAIYGRVVTADGAPIGDVQALSANYGTYDSLSVAHNRISGTALLVGHGGYENGGVEVGGAGIPISAPTQMTVIGNTRGMYHPRVIANTARREWMLVSVNGFTTTVAQRMQTASTSTSGPTGGGGGGGGGGSRKITGDFDGDGKADFAVYRASTGTWNIAGNATAWGQPGDVPVIGDYNGDGKAEIAVYRPSAGQWFVYGQSVVQWGMAGDVPVPADYDGDGRTDIAVFRPASGLWFVRGFASYTKWGASGDVPVPGDYNGDGRAEFAVFRRSTGTWYFNNGTGAVAFGSPGDIPVPADYDGDGRTDVAYYRPGNQTWAVKDQFEKQFGSPGVLPVPMDLDGDGKAELVTVNRRTGDWAVYNRAQNSVADTNLGSPGDMPLSAVLYAMLPVHADSDGDRRADPAVMRPSISYHYGRHSSTGGYHAVAFGLSSDIPVPADYDGDGRLDVGAFRPSTSMWYVSKSSSNFATYEAYGPWGLSTDVPVPGDYDGDGRADLMVFRGSSATWHMRTSSSGFQGTDSFTFGAAGDIPVPADFDGDGVKDPAVFRPSTGQWTLYLRMLGQNATLKWGQSGDIPLAADYDGDGRADLAVYRHGRWFITHSATNWTTNAVIDWGLSTDTPVIGDFNGDGFADVTVFRAGTGQWFMRNFGIYTFGGPGDLVLVKQ